MAQPINFDAKEASLTLPQNSLKISLAPLIIENLGGSFNNSLASSPAYPPSGYCSSIDYFTPYSVYDVDSLPLKSPSVGCLLNDLTDWPRQADNFASEPCTTKCSPIKEGSYADSLLLGDTKTSFEDLPGRSFSLPFAKGRSQSCDATVSPDMSLKQLPKFNYKDLEYHECIGYGASGTVFKVSSPVSPSLHPLHGNSPEKVQFFACKSIHIDVMDNEKREKLLKELLMLRKLSWKLPLSPFSSSFIVSFDGAFLKNGDLNILTGYMSLGSLDSLLKRPKYIRLQEQEGIPEKVVKYLAYCIVKALVILYRDWKILHRDVKPRNVLLDDKGFVKICDFGLATCLSAPKNASKLSPGQKDLAPGLNPDDELGLFADESFVSKKNLSLVGTTAYMSPERMLGQRYDARSDSWSFGLTLLEVVLGFFPLSHKLSKDGQYRRESGRRPLNLFEQLMWVLEGRIPVPSSCAVTTYSPDMTAFIEKCLERNIEDRPSPLELLHLPWLREAVQGGEQAEFVWYSGQQQMFSDWLRRYII